MSDFETELKNTFLEEAKQLLDEAEGDGLALAQGSYDKANIQKLFRIAHTFKGSASAAGFGFLSQLAHEYENVLDRIQKDQIQFDLTIASALLKGIDTFRESVQGLTQDFGFQPKNLAEIMENLRRLGASTGPEPMPAPRVPTLISVPVPVPALTDPSSDSLKKKREAQPKVAAVSDRKPSANPLSQDMIRISAQKLDRLIDLISELKVHRQLQGQMAFSLDDSTRPELGRDPDARPWGTDSMDKMIVEAHDLALTLRMTPLRPVFQKMQRVVWDAGGSLGKEIQFTMSGEEVELDKVIVDRVGELLTHLIRNAVDHGLEAPEERLQKGKSKTGLIQISAQVEENRAVITVSDDGYGLDRERILKKGIEKGLVQPAKALSDSEVYELIFEPGFSTRTEITDLSGRGFGMDIVREALREMGGTIDMKTVAGQGTTFKLYLPLILAVIEGLVCEVDQRKYIVSLSQVQETVDLSQLGVQKGADGSVFFNLRGEIIPLINLRALLHGAPSVEGGLKGAGIPYPGLALVSNLGIKKIAFEVDRLVASQPLALKSLGAELQAIPGIKACAILNDGEPALVIHLAELIPAESVYGRG